MYHTVVPIYEIEFQLYPEIRPNLKLYQYHIYLPEPPTRDVSETDRGSVPRRGRGERRADGEGSQQERPEVRLPLREF